MSKPIADLWKTTAPTSMNNVGFVSSRFSEKGQEITEKAYVPYVLLTHEQVYMIFQTPVDGVS